MAVPIFQRNLVYLRTLRGYNQSEMKAHVGIGGGTWSNYENGKTEPDIFKLIEISKLFGITLDELCTVDLEEANLTTTGETEKKRKTNTPIHTSNDTPNATANTQFDKNLLSQLIVAKEDTIKSQRETIDALKSSYELVNEEVKKLRIENDRLKRDVPTVDQQMESRSGKRKDTKTA